MTTPEQLDGIRSGMRAMWGAVAPAWAAHADHLDARAEAVTAALLDRAQPGPDDRVLELACGPGGLGLAAARHAREVVVSDIVPAMVETATARARDIGLGNVTGRVLDLEAIEEPDGAYDVVLCREGLMLVPEPDRAVREIARVLRPRSGRAAVAVWGPRERNPWLGVLLDAVTAQVGHPVPPPGVPGPFDLADAVRLEGLLRDAGLEEVRVDELAVPLRLPSFDAWWDRTIDLAGPLALLLRSQPPETMDAIRESARAAVASYETEGGVELPGLTLVASGRASAP